MIGVNIFGTLLTLTLFIFLLYKGRKDKKRWDILVTGFAIILLGQLLIIFSAISSNSPEHNFAIWIVTNQNSIQILFTAIGLSFVVAGIVRQCSLANSDLNKISELKSIISELKTAISEKTNEYELALIDADQFFSHLSSQNEALNASAIVSRVDLEGKITYVNESFCRITQYSLSELIGKDHKILNSNFHPVEFWSELWGAIKQHKKWRGEIKNKAKDGSYFWVDTVIVPIKNEKGKTMEYLSIRFDITERKKAEKDLAKAKNAAEDATKAKSEFLARMSHEIRTPMNAIIGLSQLALKTTLNPQQKDYISKVNSSGKSLLGIINDILDFSKIEAGKLELEAVEFDLEKVFQDIENMLGLKAYDKGLGFFIGIAPDVPISLVGDPLRLSQILINLVNNAIKFTNKGEIVIRTYLKSVDKNSVNIGFKISDTGIGIAKNNIEDLFNSFSQAENSTTRKYGGTGLGLAISLKLAKSMHGDIEVESSPGIGSEFNFFANFGIAEKQKRDLLILPQNLQNLNVFIVNNNETSQSILKDILESFHCNVHLFSEGIDVLNALENGENCEITILEWNLPGWSGIKTAEEIHKSPKIKSLPHVIISTNSKNNSLIEFGNQFGITEVLNMPTNYTSVFNLILKIHERSDLIIPSFTNEDFENEALMKQINGACILLVEDNEVNQQVAREILESVGCRVEIAINGFDAVEIIFKHPTRYELILMDIQMPIMDGYTASSKIRENKLLDTIPIVAITADAIVGIKDKCLNVGMNDIITKPFEPDRIFEILLKFIKFKERKKVEIKVNNVEEIQLPIFKTIDTTEGVNRVNKNKELYVKLIRNYYLNYNQIIEKTITAYTSNDQLLAKRLIHTLKGISGNLGAKAVYSICQDLELQDNLDKDQLIKKLDPLKFELNRVFDEISPFIKELEQKETTEASTTFEQPNIQEIRKILLILNRQLERSDADSIETLKRLQDISGIKAYRSIVIKIENELNQYNFDEALKLVNGFIEELKS